MNLQKLGNEHTCDIDALPESPIILDVGARGFDYDFELLVLRPKATIIALEPDPLTIPPGDPRIRFLNRAMTEKGVDSVMWQGEGDGSYIVGKPGDPGYGWGMCDEDKLSVVPNCTMAGLMLELGIKHWDLVKLDCEGSEFGILQHWPGPIATQISVEFHDTMNPNKWNDKYFEYLFSDPLHDYEVVQHELLPLGPKPSFGHWDTLLRLRK